MLLLAFSRSRLQHSRPRPRSARASASSSRRSDGPETVVGGDDCSRRTLPASTFKVPHALVALQTRVVTAKTVINWDGMKRDYRRVEPRSDARVGDPDVGGLGVSAVRDGDRPRPRARVPAHVQLRLGDVRARRHQLLAERRPADLAGRGGRVSPPHVHVRPAGGPRPHRHGEGGSDDAAREVRERGRRARLRAALARRTPSSASRAATGR